MKRLLISQLAVILLMTACGGPTPTQLAKPTPEPTYTPYPTPTVIAITSPTATLAPTTYVVQPGDTLTSIAAQYGITAEIICAFNALADCNLIHAGQELLIPPEEVTPTIPTPSPTAAQGPTATPTTLPPTPTPTLAAETAQVVGIIDGDTIDVQIGGQTFRVRYIGMNTPESGQPCGAEATNYNAELVEGKAVTLVKDVSETDQYGRLLRYVYLGDIFVNAELVRQGYANAATYPPDVAYADLFVQLEAEARAEGRGCWAIPTPTSGATWNCVGNIFNCSDFSSCEQVMSYWRACPGDPSRLDGDNDGIPCEVLCQ